MFCLYSEHILLNAALARYGKTIVARVVLYKFVDAEVAEPPYIILRLFGYKGGIGPFKTHICPYFHI